MAPANADGKSPLLGGGRNNPPPPKPVQGGRREGGRRDCVATRQCGYKGIFANRERCPKCNRDRHGRLPTANAAPTKRTGGLALAEQNKRRQNGDRNNIDRRLTAKDKEIAELKAALAAQGETPTEATASAGDQDAPEQPGKQAAQERVDVAKANLARLDGLSDEDPIVANLRAKFRQEFDAALEAVRSFDTDVVRVEKTH